MFTTAQKSDKIWVFREGLERAESFLLSKLPMDVYDVDDFCRYIQRRYNDHYGSMTDKDSIRMKIKRNTEEAAYILFVATGKPYQARPLNVKKFKKRKWPIKEWSTSRTNRKALPFFDFWSPKQEEDLPSYSKSIQTPIWNHNANVPDQSTSKAAEAYGAKLVKQYRNEIWESDQTLFPLF